MAPSLADPSRPEASKIPPATASATEPSRAPTPSRLSSRNSSRPASSASPPNSAPIPKTPATSYASPPCSSPVSTSSAPPHSGLEPCIRAPIRPASPNRHRKDPRPGLRRLTRLLRRLAQSRRMPAQDGRRTPLRHPSPPPDKSRKKRKRTRQVVENTRRHYWPPSSSLNPPPSWPSRLCVPPALLGYSPRMRSMSSRTNR